MWLDDNYLIKSYKGGKPQFKNGFIYWRNKLFNMVCKLYTWFNLPFPQKEIETRLILWGRCGVQKSTKKDILLATNANLWGVTDFYDEFSNYSWTTPLENGQCEIGKNGVCINNDTLRNPIIPIIDRYAMLLTHVEISFVNCAVNGRSSKTAIAGNDKMKEAIREYQNKLYEGAPDVIVDKAFLNYDEKLSNTTPLEHLKTLYDVRQALLYSFYEDLGIKKNQQKRERLISDEVSADNSLLKLNILDMTDEREKACKEINRIFGTNISVKCNVDYDDNGVVDGEESEAKKNETKATNDIQ